MPISLFHPSLNATLHGVSRGPSVWQFRGLSYGTIRSRFASPGLPDVISGDVDCTTYGPRCPQNFVDFRHMLRIPEDEQIPAQEEDEFSCLNLDVTMPSLEVVPSLQEPFPVLIWIHGGSQAVTFGSSASRLCDPSGIVARSVVLNTPIIIVTLNYRLNIFAFGDMVSERNLALKDQRRAVEYVASHIEGFNGDPKMITIAGESAGAVYCHAHGITSIPARQCILQSGTLYLSPPQPRATAEALIQNMEQAVAEKGGWTLRSAPVSALLETQERLGLISYYLQMDDDLEGWQHKTCRFERCLIGDCEYESALWRNGIESSTPTSISRAFDVAGKHAASLKKKYGILPDRAVSSKLGALDFLNDARFTWPLDIFVRQHRQAGRQVFLYLFDQPNPWQTSSRAHHGVDLIYLFGQFNSSLDEVAQDVSQTMQDKWIVFVRGENPHGPREVFTFGPVGACQVINYKKIGTRRRQKYINMFEQIGYETVNKIVGTLGYKKSSLYN